MLKTVKMVSKSRMQNRWNWPENWPERVDGLRTGERDQFTLCSGVSMDHEAWVDRRKRFLSHALRPSIARTTTSTNSKTVANRR